MPLILECEDELPQTGQWISSRENPADGSLLLDKNTNVETYTLPGRNIQPNIITALAEYGSDITVTELNEIAQSEANEIAEPEENIYINAHTDDREGIQNEIRNLQSLSNCDGRNQTRKSNRLRARQNDSLLLDRNTNVETYTLPGRNNQPNIVTALAEYGSDITETEQNEIAQSEANEIAEPEENIYINAHTDDGEGIQFEIRNLQSLSNFDGTNETRKSNRLRARQSGGKLHVDQCQNGQTEFDAMGQLDSRSVCSGENEDGQLELDDLDLTSDVDVKPDVEALKAMLAEMQQTQDTGMCVITKMATVLP